MRRNHDHRHVLVNQRNGPVLQFAGRIAFRVNVGNFLELQRAFHGDGIVDAAPEVEHVLGMGNFPRHAGNVLLLLQDFRHVAGRFNQGAHEFLLQGF